MGKDFPKLYKVDGSVKVMIPRDGKKFTLEELKQMVDGYIQIVPLPSGRVVVCNEEGKLNDLPINQNATEKVWYHEFPVSKFGMSDVLVGNVLVCDNHYIS